MPLVFVLFALVILLILAVVTMPLALVLRYRAGTATRPARAWVATINMVGAGASAVMLLIFSAITTIWIPRAFLWTVAGALTGAVLGLIGLAATRWIVSPRALSYTPPRLLILTITVIVTGRLLFGFWRMWNAWKTTPDLESWVASSGTAGAMGAGAVVLGYYLVYWAGLLRKLNRYRQVTR